MADAYHYFGECGGPEKCEFCASVEGRVAAMDRLAEVEAVARQLAAALAEIASSRENCIYRRDDNGGADYREGSNAAFRHCAEIADDALAAFRAAFPEEPDGK